MTENNEHRFINPVLLFWLIYLTVQVGLIWATIYFIVENNFIGALIPFLSFLGLGVMIFARFVVIQVTRLIAMVEVALKIYYTDNVKRPTEEQIDGVLRCGCEECAALRKRFGLPDRTNEESLLVPDEE